MIINTEKKIVESDNRLYALKDNKGLLAARPSHNRADLYKKAKILESRTNKKYIVEEYKDFVETSSISESILDKDRKINEPVYRRYYMDGKEVDRDTFYDTIIMTDVTDQQMIELENNKNRNNPVEIDGVKYFIDQSERDDEIEEEEKEEDNNLSAYTDIKKMEESSVPLKESVEDGIYNIVIYKHDLSGFFDSIDYFDEGEAQLKAQELVSFPDKYSDVKIIQMKKTDRNKFFSDQEKQDKFLDDGEIPENLILGEVEIEDVSTEDDIPDEEVIVDKEEVKEEPKKEEEEEYITLPPNLEG